MTEKQYNLRAGYYHNYTGICSDTDENLTTNKVVDLLNEQEEEISNLQLIIGVNGKAYRKSVKEYEEFIEELEQENEQLKKEKKELQCQCNLLREQKNEFHRIALENGNRVGQLEKRK